MFKLFFLFLLTLNIFANEVLDKLVLIKIEKTLQKEEEIAYAYKKYILKNAKAPSSLSDLIDENGTYLPLQYDRINSFGREIILENNKIKNSIPLDEELKMNIYDYYYANKNRIYTKAPLNLQSSSVNIVLNESEKYILKFQDKISTIKDDAKTKTNEGGYYLDGKGVLHWYDENGNYLFSKTDNLLVNENGTILNSDGSINSVFMDFLKSKDAMYAGEKILRKNQDSIEEYLNTDNSVIKIGTKVVSDNILRFNKYGGGMLVNGDVYIWGNDSNNITALGQNAYTKDGVVGVGTPVINSFIKSKAIVYDDTKTIEQNINDYTNKNFFSSSLRPRFKDFFSDVKHSTCAVSMKGELYCGGKDALENNYISFLGYTKGSNTNLEYMYRSVMFDGINYKVEKVLALGNTYIVLGKKNTDTIDGYGLYYFGKDNKNGWAGTGLKSEINIITPTYHGNSSTALRFKDIVYSFQDGGKIVFALDTLGNIYTWGLNSSTYACEVGGVNFCFPSKLEADVNFVSIMGSQNCAIAQDGLGNFYKISQSGTSKAKKELFSDFVKLKSDFVEADDLKIISIDTTLQNGIVWINEKNELKGDYYIPLGADEVLFREAISKTYWKKIKVIEDNLMCAIDIRNQMYCWGNMQANGMNTFALPMFNANLHDESKDYLFVENSSTNVITNMTSGIWTDSNNKYIIKYPTYFSGFNYDFIFK